MTTTTALGERLKQTIPLDAVKDLPVKAKAALDAIPGRVSHAWAEALGQLGRVLRLATRAEVEDLRTRLDAMGRRVELLNKKRAAQ